ncbi:unnamed protein product [Mytilus coruscus]|uniref:Uncharacterized protein n=1 Tax=Mytilus coruscus TaxID=42192 RepID=A0A6J7ZX67_MYTCO|nr:unnamed protein product [Mytilus coruscus]
MATRINLPSFSKLKSYELYKQELIAWSEITDLDKKKRGIAVALTLPEDDEKFLDKHLAKDNLADSLEKFEDFEDFTRPEAENKEPLWAAGYVKRDNSYGYKCGGQYSRGGGRGQGFQSSKRGAKNLNPTGPDGKPLTCTSCGSYRHLVAKCPDSCENWSKVNITEEEEHAVLFTGYHKQDIKQLGNDARNCAVLDSACS